MKPVTAWGRLGADPHHVVGLNDRSTVKSPVCHRANQGVALGMGHSNCDVNLALDFPNKEARTQKLFKWLDAMVGEAAGRIYLVKGVRMPRELFEAGYQRLNEFMNYRDPDVSSGLSLRFMGVLN